MNRKSCRYIYYGSVIALIWWGLATFFTGNLIFKAQNYSGFAFADYRIWGILVITVGVIGFVLRQRHPELGLLLFTATWFLIGILFFIGAWYGTAPPVYLALSGITLRAFYDL